MAFALQAAIHAGSALCAGARRRSATCVQSRSAVSAFPARTAAWPAQRSQTRSTVLQSYSGQSGNPATSARLEAQLESLRKELKGLEEERDSAVATAESCAKTCVRLTDMSKLLEDLALEKVKAGDEAGAKNVLAERSSLREIIDKSNAKAQSNFQLAGKLASLIGDKHNELLRLMKAGGPQRAAPAPPIPSYPSPSAPSGPSYASYTSSPPPPSSSPFGAGAGAGWPGPSSADSGYGAGTASYGSGAYGGGAAAPWQRSLEDAQQRVRQAESDAQRMGRLAALGAEESIAAARERLAERRREQGAGATEGILQARDRLRLTAEESIAEARERLRLQDQQILEYCRRIVARYRRGEPVGEDELEFAFAQLERRLL